MWAGPHTLWILWGGPLPLPASAGRGHPLAGGHIVRLCSTFTLASLGSLLRTLSLDAGWTPSRTANHTSSQPGPPTGSGCTVPGEPLPVLSCVLHQEPGLSRTGSHRHQHTARARHTAGAQCAHHPGPLWLARLPPRRSWPWGLWPCRGSREAGLTTMAGRGAPAKHS